MVRSLSIASFALLAVVAALPLRADVEAECRSEAEEFGIATEQLQDYMDACIASRGGNGMPLAEQSQEAADLAAQEIAAEGADDEAAAAEDDSPVPEGELPQQ